MALQAPTCVDVTDFKFNLLSNARIFNQISNEKCTLLATASTLGVVIVGCSLPELRVVPCSSIEAEKAAAERILPIRRVPLSSQPFQIAINCDNTLLAIDVNVNGVPHIQIYSVPSFLTNNVIKITEFRSSQQNERTTQILWNPVMSNVLCICTEQGGLSAYNLKDQGFEFHSIEANEKAHCACWSPKGKQIVVGFANGNLVQYKPDLKPARKIPSPPSLAAAGGFNVIALQWLSTYQFAAVFLGYSENSTPALHIINAPKAGNPTYINYDDVCFSQPGPRKGQMFLLHILQWNLLLVASANSMEVAMLGTKEAGELPTWVQWVTGDDGRADLPLCNKEDQFPIGFSLDTGCSRQLVITDVLYPLMPVIHLLSTHGYLVSFHLLNTSQSYVDICSPARPLDGQVMSLFADPQDVAEKPQTQCLPQTTSSTDLSFATSTPAKPQSVFGKIEPVKPTFSLDSIEQPATGITATSAFSMTPSTGGLFGSLASSTTTSVAPTLSFGSLGGFSKPSTQTPPVFGVAPPQVLSFGTPQATGFTKPPPAIPAPKIDLPIPAVVSEPEKCKPLISVPPTYTASLHKPESKQDDSSITGSSVNSEENVKLFNKMIQEEIMNFEKELKVVLAKSKAIDIYIGDDEEKVQMIRSIEELQELKKEATETADSLRSDLQSLRLGLNEIFAMQSEAKTKCSIYNNEKSLFLKDNQIMNKTSRRHLEKLTQILSQNEMQLKVVLQTINAQWSEYQETLKQNRKNRMHVPSLEGLYQTLSKHQEIIYRHREKIVLLKSKLGIRDEIKKPKLKSFNTTVESLTDSLISLSMAEQVQQDTSKLTERKIRSLKEMLKDRKTILIKPNRPDRVDLNSEFIIEKKTQIMNRMKKANNKEAAKQSGTMNIKPVSNISSVAPKAVEKPPPAFTGLYQQQPNETPANISIMPIVPLSTIPVQPKFVMPPQQQHPVHKQPQPSQTFSLPPQSQAAKPPSTISSANVTVSATFSIPLKNKVATVVDSGKAPTSGFSFQNSIAGGSSVTTPAVVDKKPLPDLGSNVFGSKKAENKENNTSIFSMGGLSGLGSDNKFLGSATDPSKTNFSFASGTSSGFSFGGSDKPLTFAALAPATSIFPSEPPQEIKEQKITIPAKLPEVEKPIISFGKPAVPPTSSVASSPFSVLSLTAEKPKSSISSGFSLPTTTNSISPVENDQSKAPKVNVKGFFNLAGDVKDGENDLKEISEAPKSTSNFASLNMVSTSLVPNDSMTFSFVNSAKPAGSGTISTASDVKLNPNPIALGLKQLVGPEEPKVPLTPPTSPVFPTSTATAAPTAQNTASPESIFSSFNICNPEQPKVSVAPTGNLFGSTSFSSPSVSTNSIFGGSPKPEGTSAFGSQTVPASSQAPIFGAPSFPTSTANTSIFGGFGTASNESTPSSGFFGNLVKPDQNVMNKFETSAADTPATVTSSFSSQGGSAFGNSGGLFASFNTPTPQGAQSSNIFGSSSFGATTQDANSGGSLFGTSSFGQAPATSNSIFGGGNSNVAPSGFGSNVFGSQPVAPATSAFGSSSFGQTPGTGAFGSGAFSQGGAVSQTGFNSSLSPSFAKPPAFGSAPTFGGTATFGGAAAFGSTSPFNNQKTGFGFAQHAAQPTSTSPNQANNSMFEQLGSSSSGIGFGNLAQNTNTASSSGFGGPAFGGWR